MLHSILTLVYLTALSHVHADSQAVYGSLTYDTGATGQFDIAAMLAATNQARAQYGANPLSLDSRLCASAKAHCQSMASNPESYEHYTPSEMAKGIQLIKTHLDDSKLFN